MTLGMGMGMMLEGEDPEEKMKRDMAHAKWCREYYSKPSGQRDREMYAKYRKEFREQDGEQ